MLKARLYGGEQSVAELRGKLRGFLSASGGLYPICSSFCFCLREQKARESLYFMGVLMVGAARFELATPSPPDWCANRAALRSDEENPLNIGPFCTYRFWGEIAIVENRGRKVPKSVHRAPKYSRSMFAVGSQSIPVPPSPRRLWSPRSSA